MSEHHHDVLSDLNPQHRALRQMIPHVYRGFAEMSSAALTSGALDKRIKELIGLAIGVVAGCDGCIASHAQGAVRAGASKEEAAEAIGVTFSCMVGRPLSMVLGLTTRSANSLTQARRQKRPDDGCGRLDPRLLGPFEASGWHVRVTATPTPVRTPSQPGMPTR